MSTSMLIFIAFLIILFIKPIQMIVVYTEQYVKKMVIINSSEDFIDFDKRANAVAKQLENLGPVRVEDLPDLFRDRNLTLMNKKINP